MRNLVIGMVMTVVAVGSLVLLFFGEWLFSILPRVRQLKKTSERVGALLIKDGPFTVPIREIVRHQLANVCKETAESDKFKEFGVVVDIVRLREKAHQNFLKDVRKLSAALLGLYIWNITISVYRNNFIIPTTRAVFEWIGDNPLSLFGVLELTALVFIVIRLIREHDDLRELLD